jgi:hypothetical protein
VSVQYGSLSGSIASKSKTFVGIKSGPNQVAQRTTPIEHGRSYYSGFCLSPAGKNACQVNLSSTILRRELVALTVLAGIKRPYHASPAGKMEPLWLISTRGVVLNLLGDAGGGRTEVSDSCTVQYKSMPITENKIVCTIGQLRFGPIG